ncbi:MAG: OmpA family protein [Ignavibacteriaceae bacterium]|nr:OmpA family protein [Ignavibacteriaceae bacterium]
MRYFFAVIICVITITNSFPQSPNKTYYHAFSGTTVLTFEGGTTIAMTNYSDIHPQYLGTGSLEYFFSTFTKSSFGLRAFGETGFIGGKDATKVPDIYRTSFSCAGAGFVYMLQAGQSVFPYFFAGGSYLWFDPRYGDNNSRLPNNKAGAYPRHEFNFNGELGTRFLITDNLSFNLNGGVQVSPNNYWDDLITGAKNDLFFHISAGFSYSFLSDQDSDGDGVPDSRDNCPDTPTGVQVDEYGCPLDSDGDGVPDYLDKCPNTPRGVKVDRNGCPIDSDGDGVPDYLDICPNTPHEVRVDEFGCPLDTDGDGVPDYLDNCPNTPHRVEVDKHGCPLDSDGDGVPDYLDKCPNTPYGTKVDSSGCPVIVKETILPPQPEETESGEIVLSAGTNFVLGKTDINSEAIPELNKVLVTMKKYPLSRWSIEGYTDNSGSNKMNLKISLGRAQSVANYFISNGVPKNRLKVYGKGSSNPVASNNTDAGKAKNRRVVIKRVN